MVLRQYSNLAEVLIKKFIEGRRKKEGRRKRKRKKEEGRICILLSQLFRLLSSWYFVKFDWSNAVMMSAAKSETVLRVENINIFLRRFQL
jgi:hypothetical protein